MIRRRAIAAGLVLAGVLASELVTAGTAAAGGPGGTTSTTAGCNGGGACWNGLSQYLRVDPSPYSNPGGGNAGVSLADVPPPPCWMQYFNTGPGAYQWWQGYTHSGDPSVAAGIGSGGYGQQFYDHRNDPPSVGTWYTAVENPSGPADGAQCVASLPEFEWVPAGGTPQLPQIPQRDLALYALSTLQLPTPQFELSPNNRSYVTLPTFVILTGGNPPGPITLTAHLGNVESATVTVTNNGLTFDTQNAQQYHNCGPQGTNESQAQMDKAGPGTTPDCGVVYSQPSTGFAQGYPFRVGVSWTATFGGQPIGPNPMQMWSQTHYIPVAEIQSINNGSG